MKRIGFYLLGSAIFSQVAFSFGDEIEGSNMQRVIEPFAIVEPNSLEPIENVKGTPFYLAARSVARASLDGYCTAFRVAKDLFMTNNHCFIDTNCSRTTFTLGYEEGIPEDKRPVFQCKEIMATAFMLDYALVKVEEKNRGVDSLKEYPPVVIAKAPYERNGSLFIVGHPKARKKEIDRSEQCRVIDNTFDQIHHTCDSEEGSSGAPLFDLATGEVIAINWGGGEDENAATKMSAIVEDIKNQLGYDPF